MSVDVKTILNKAKESYDRYFKDIPDLPEAKEGSDVIYDKEKMNQIIDKKTNQLDGHMANLQALRRELEEQAEVTLNSTFTADNLEYTKTAVNQMIADYEDEKNRIEDLKKRLNNLKK